MAGLVSALNELRRELERRQKGDPEVHVCELHGEHETLVCLDCYAIQQERVERESVGLRVKNTAPRLRLRVAAELATRNGKH